MSYLALYRKYRPNSFEDLVGQSYVSDIIRKEIINNQISHAYLFSGPRGTGKTSTAKIIARMINCSNLDSNGNPCGKCESCLNINNNSDIVEIDAASNNGVDEIRELRDKVNLVPTTSKYKIYIIDEVHMLTTQAFNALLKTLEEPPSHIIFILATTELHKIPITVVSRCQKFQFKKFTDDEIVERLLKISKLENINVEKDVLFEIARLSDGGLRDAINMLDQLSSYKDNGISVNDVYKLNGVVSYNEIFDLLSSIYNKDINFITTFIDNLDRNGNNICRFLEDLIAFLKDVLLFLNSVSKVNIKEKSEKIENVSKLFTLSQIYDIIFSINDLLGKIRNSSCSTILTTTFFLNLSLSLNSDNVSIEDKKQEEIVNSIDDSNSDKETENSKIVSIEEDFEISEKKRKILINNSFATASKQQKDLMIKNWNLIDDKMVNDKYGSIAALLNDIEIEVVGDGYIIMMAKYDSLLRRLYKNLCLIEELLEETFNKKYKVVFVVNDEWDYERNKYIQNLKKGIKYNIIDFSENDSDIVDNDSDDNIDKIVSILGKDIIEYK